MIFSFLNGRRHQKVESHSFQTKKTHVKKFFLAELWLFKVDVFRKAQKRKFQCGGELGA